MKNLLIRECYMPRRMRCKRFFQIITIELLFLLFLCTSLNAANTNSSVKANTLAGVEAEQQDVRRVSGIVLDNYGEPIIGAIVLEKGSVNGTNTDADGLFAIEVKEGAILQITYLGYLPQEIVIKDQTKLNITLVLDEQILDEIVVVGYGTMKKKDLTGAMTNISGDNIAARKTTELSTALQGAASGVMVTRDDSSPGATAKIVIRGITTFNESSPLVIVDGVPGDINQINPEDVESMSVLKDAASASIYGSRAAAGVIVITTKRASDTEVRLNYSFDYGWEVPTQLPKYVEATRFMGMTNEMLYNDNKSGGWNQTYSDDQINNWYAKNATDPDKYPNDNWQKALLKSSSTRMTHSINISGGSKNVRTKASFRYDKSDGLYKNKSYERYMVRVNNDFEVNKFIKAHVDFNLKRAQHKSSHGNPFNALNIPPIYAIRWKNGMWGDVKDGGNILAGLEEGGLERTWNNGVGGKVGLDITPFKGLTVSAVIAPNFNFDKTKSHIKKIPFTYADDPEKVIGYVGGFRTTSLSEKRDDDYDVTSQVFVNYIKSFNKHSFTAMVGAEDYHATWENMGASRDEYELNYPYLDIGPLKYRDNLGNGRKYAYRSFFGRLTYSYADRYLLQANIRRDGSSRFAKDHRWGTFPSFSGGWVISEENFLKEQNINWLSFLKLRASWGKLGNERISSYYPYQASIDFGNALLHNGKQLESVTTGAQSTYAVNDITWETTTTWDVGIDAYFLNNRLRFVADLYRKNTKDMLIPLEIPKFMGYDNPSVNGGNMHTTGYDMEFSWSDRVNEFSYAVTANFSDFKSVMDDLKGTEFLGEQVKKQGGQFNEWYGYVSEGLFLTQSDLENSPTINANTQLGDIKYKDISGPDGVPDGIISPEYDQVFLGGSLPRYMFGLNLSAAYKGFDLSMMFQGVGSQNSRLTLPMVEVNRDNWKNFPALLDNNYWSEKNTNEQNANAKYPRLTATNKKANQSMSNHWMFNGRYLRMKNLTLGYTLPKALTEKAKVSKLRVFLSASDIFCLDNYPKGWDPESTTGYPITTSVLLGFSLDF